MRIIGGKFKGRRFNPPAKNWPTRPTTDLARESLYNILTNKIDFENSSVLDLFGGTGSHSYECISRGCCDVTYVDRFYPCIRFVESMSKELGILNCIKIHKRDVFKFLAKCKNQFDYIFAGPPYAMANQDDLPGLVFQNDLLKDGGIFVLEHNHKHAYSNHPRFSELRKYGQCHFSFFQ
jgi:16S rRNA (guanine(966)-N(2))-methyltransferase RsmD